MPLIGAEVNSYAWLVMALKMASFLELIRWEELSSENVHLIKANSDRFVKNSGLKVIARRTGWSCYGLDAYHVGLMVNKEMSLAFVNDLPEISSDNA